MTHTWFIYSNEIVKGPFNTEQIQNQLEGGELSPSSLIWWRGQREWMPLSLWQNKLPDILEDTQPPSENRIWYLEMNTESIGPLTQTEVINNLKNLKDLNPARVWTAGMKKWTKVYEVHEIMEPLGISRRTNKRAPLTGAVAVTRSNDDPRGFLAKAASISIAGMGITGAQDLRRGDFLALVIKSPDLPGNIHLRGEVAYVTAQGYAGIRFERVHAETQSLLYDYVKRFNPELASEKQSVGRPAA